MSYTTEQIRNIAVAGHGSTGKTSLVENLLFVGGQIDRPESVASGKTVSDFSEEEIEHKISIHSSLSHIIWKNHKINILDTPGASDFVGEVIASFRAAESAVLLVDGEAGVQIETIKLWRSLDQRNKPRIVFVNKMDKERASFERTLADLSGKFKTPFIPLTMPMGTQGSYEGIIDLIHMRAYIPGGSGKKESETEIPEQYRDAAKAAHEAMIDAAAEGDDELTEKFLEGGELSIDEAVRGIMEDLRDHKVVPVFCGSAHLCSGITAFLDILNLIAPSPLGLNERVVGPDKKETEKEISPQGSLGFFSFKTSLDQFAGKLSYVKMVSGTLKPEAEVFNVREQRREKTAKIYTSQGKKLEELSELIAGDIGIIAKLGSAHTNDSYSEPGNTIEFVPLVLPQPVYRVAISAANKKDEDKMTEFMSRVIEEDKTVRMNYNGETRETVLAGMGEMHLGLIFERLRKLSKIEVHTRVPKIAYRETISLPAEAEYTHKKQSGGHGQYARVNLKIRPLERGKRFSFVNDVHGGAISRNYIPGVEKGVIDAMAEGSLAGFPVVDLEATVFDGKEHPVDSSDMAFQLAARGAVKDALTRAKAILLEPIMKLRIFVEEKYLGDILSDVSAKRGRVISQSALGGEIIEVDAEAPQSELLRYAIDLRSMTSGTGSFEAEFARYAVLGGKLADDVIKAAAQVNQAETVAAH